MPKAEDRRKPCPYCGKSRGMYLGTDMCLQCGHLYEQVRDNLPTLLKLVPVKFPNIVIKERDILDEE